MKSFLATFVLGALLISSAAQAALPTQPVTNPIGSFQSVIQVPPVSVVVPTVVAVPLSGNVSFGQQFQVRENETGTFIGSYLPPRATALTPLQINKVPPDGTGQMAADQNPNTYINFEVPEEGTGVARMIVTTATSITTSKLDLSLAQYVALPLTVEIKAHVADSVTPKTVVAKKSMSNKTVTFPETTSSLFEITFTYAQPLRIAEISFSQVMESEGEQMLRFLAQPNYSYDIYFDADQSISVRPTESGNLRLNEGVLQLPEYQSRLNSEYIPADIDKDGVRDISDNCVQVANSDQVDIDRNGRGDACDDYDRDGRINSADNCVNIPNANQADEDGDRIGDVCDTEESRFTEKNPWIPWVGMGTAAAVLAILFMLVARGTKRGGVVTDGATASDCEAGE